MKSTQRKYISQSHYMSSCFQLVSITKYLPGFHVQLDRDMDI